MDRESTHGGHKRRSTFYTDAERDLHIERWTSRHRDSGISGCFVKYSILKSSQKLPVTEKKPKCTDSTSLERKGGGGIGYRINMDGTFTFVYSQYVIYQYPLLMRTAPSTIYVCTIILSFSFSGSRSCKRNVLCCKCEYAIKGTLFVQ